MHNLLITRALSFSDGVSLLPKGVRIGVPLSRPILSPSHQARQFEYHYTQPLMGIGTIDGNVILANWEKRQVLGKATLPNVNAHGMTSGGNTRIHESGE